MQEREHIAKAAAMAAAAYPNWNPTRATLEAWSALLPDVDPDEFLEAMVGHIRGSKFPPTVHDLLARAQALKPAKHSEGLPAWSEVHRAIQASGQPPGGWSDDLTGPALDMLGGWSRVMGCQSSEIASLRSRFCEGFDSLARAEASQAERETVAAISQERELLPTGENKGLIG